MPDLTLCTNDRCPHRTDCDRRQLEASSGHQSYAFFAFCARIADEFGYELGTVMENNKKKLEDRLIRGVINGNGDNR